MSLITDTIVRKFTSSRKTKMSGEWITGNAPCCQHNGQTPDKRGRGHLKVSPNGTIAWGCFNCGFKAYYEPGHQFPYSFRKLLKWCGADESEIHLLVFEALREKEILVKTGAITETPKQEELKVSFKKHELPKGAQSMLGLVEFYELLADDVKGYPDDFCKVVDYGAGRCLNFQKYEFYWTPDTTYKMNKRLIIPFIWKGEVIGYTARAIDDAITPKYLMEVDDGFVFNMDNQAPNRQFALVMEGPMDALVVDGLAVLHDRVNKQQIAMIESLNREIIVVPDFNKSGTGLVQCAMEQGWSVSFPVWSEKVKDVSAAVEKYGRLFAMKDIVDNVERKKLKIELRWKKYGR